jgi:hypothetical protein
MRNKITMLKAFPTTMDFGNFESKLFMHTTNV